MTRLAVATLALACLIASGVAVTARQASSTHVLFVGTYTSGTSKGIYSFRFDDRTGVLAPAGLAAETPNPSFLTASADGRFVYAVNELKTFQGQDSGSVTAFAVDRTRTRLMAIDTQSSRGADPCDLVLDRTGRFLAVANYTGGTFAILPVALNGSIGPATQVLTHTGKGPNADRQDGPHAHEAVFDASNRFLLGVDLGLDRVFVYRFNARTGEAGPNDAPFVSLPPGTGPRHIVFDPTGRFAFVVSELASTVTTLAWDGQAGRFKTAGTVSMLPPDFHDTNTAAEIVVHPNGRVVYASNRGHDSIAVLRMGVDGALTRVATTPTRGKTPRFFTLDPTGRWLIAANQDTNSLAVFRVDPTTGALTPSGDLTTVGSPVCVLFMS